MIQPEPAEVVRTRRLWLVAIANVCNRLHNVRWDRTAGDDTNRVVYGWVDRDDGCPDFVVLTFDRVVSDDSALQVSLVTSAEAHYDEFRQAIYGSGVAGHDDKRVADVFGDLLMGGHQP